MYEPFFNSVISDIALDRGQYALDLEFEGTDVATELSALSQRNLSSTGGGVSRGDSVPPKLSLDDKAPASVRRAPKVGVRGLSGRWLRVEKVGR